MEIVRWFLMFLRVVILLLNHWKSVVMIIYCDLLLYKNTSIMNTFICWNYIEFVRILFDSYN